MTCDILGYLLQGCLSPAYRICGMERGTGMFQRIKDYLSGGIDKHSWLSLTGMSVGSAVAQW